MNTAIIVAAGSGSRFDPENPKQLVEICGKPLVVHTFERFAECASVDAIVLVLPSKAIENARRLDAFSASAKPLKFVEGGPTRAHSVFNGLAVVDPETVVVAVHDGARPLVTCEEIAKTIEAAARTGAACLVARMTDTIKEVKDGQIARTIDRNSLRTALTPQAFRLEVLQKAFSEAELNENITDECSLVERLGMPIVVVEGSRRNIKITERDDLNAAQAFLSLRASGK